MLDTILHNHTRTVVDGEGRQVTVKATCAEVNGLIGSHVVDGLVPDGNGGQKMGPVVISCADAHAELTRLTTAEQSLTAQVGQLTTQVATLTATVEDQVRLMKGAMQIVFRMGPELNRLLAEGLADPVLTDDGTAVKVDTMLFTVLIDSFGEEITVRDRSGVVPDRTFAVVNGRISTDNQTLLIGHVERIKKAAGDDGSDPVIGTIGLVKTGQRPA
ncbi:MAG TPA: hypothetical protein VFZ62_00285 [Candidatus Saccharimonadales bacterium]